MTAHKNEENRGRLGAVAAFTSLCTALGMATAHAETRFEPRIGVDATWTDNVELAPPGADKRSELIGQLKPGFRLVHASQSLQAFVDYQLQLIRFQDSPDSNEVFHQAQLGVQFAAIPEWFFVDLGGVRSQAVVDPRQPANVDNLFQVGNLADATSGQVSPILQHTFRLMELEASYTRGFLSYSKHSNESSGNVAFDDSQNERETFALRSPDDEALVTWETRYQHDKVDYDTAQTFEYDVASGEIGVRVAAPLRLIARGGLESDPRQQVSSGGLDESYWQGGFSWRKSERSELRILAGRRFFGTSYDALWHYTGRLLEADASYYESPATQAQGFVVRAITAPGDFPTQIDPDFSRTTSDIYILKQLNGRIGLRGRLTEVYLSVNSERREYITLPGLEDKYQGANVLASRRLGPRVRLELQAGFIDTRLREGDDYREYIYSVRLERRIGTHTVLTLAGNRRDRTGGIRPYDANWVVLGINVNFAGPERNTGGADNTRSGTRKRPGLPTVPARP